MTDARFYVAAATLALLGWAGSAHAQPHTIAIIGTGNVGSALGERFGALGHRIVYGSRSPADAEVAALAARSGTGARAVLPAEAVRDADLVVLALPGGVVEEVVRSLGDLGGRIVIDPTNPYRAADDGYRDFAFDGSNAERIQTLAPEARVVKAFNTLNYTVMRDPAAAGGPVTIPLVGDDAEAKRTVAALARAIGLEAIDVGPLRHARVVEGFHLLRYNAGRTEGRFNYHLRLEPSAAQE